MNTTLASVITGKSIASIPSDTNTNAKALKGWLTYLVSGFELNRGEESTSCLVVTSTAAKNQGHGTPYHYFFPTTLSSDGQMIVGDKTPYMFRARGEWLLSKETFVDLIDRLTTNRDDVSAAICPMIMPVPVIELIAFYKGESTMTPAVPAVLADAGFFRNKASAGRSSILPVDLDKAWELNHYVKDLPVSAVLQTSFKNGTEGKDAAGPSLAAYYWTQTPLSLPDRERAIKALHASAEGDGEPKDTIHDPSRSMRCAGTVNNKPNARAEDGQATCCKGLYVDGSARVANDDLLAIVTDMENDPAFAQKVVLSPPDSATGGSEDYLDALAQYDSEVALDDDTVLHNMVRLLIQEGDHDGQFIDLIKSGGANAFPMDSDQHYDFVSLLHRCSRNHKQCDRLFNKLGRECIRSNQIDKGRPADDAEVDRKIGRGWLARCKNLANNKDGMSNLPWSVDPAANMLLNQINTPDLIPVTEQPSATLQKVGDVTPDLSSLYVTPTLCPPVGTQYPAEPKQKDIYELHIARISMNLSGIKKDLGTMFALKMDEIEPEAKHILTGDITKSKFYEDNKAAIAKLGTDSQKRSHLFQQFLYVVSTLKFTEWDDEIKKAFVKMKDDVEGVAAASGIAAHNIDKAFLPVRRNVTIKISDLLAKKRLCEHSLEYLHDTPKHRQQVIDSISDPAVPTSDTERLYPLFNELIGVIVEGSTVHMFKDDAKRGEPHSLVRQGATITKMDFADHIVATYGGLYAPGVKGTSNAWRMLLGCTPLFTVIASGHYPHDRSGSPLYESRTGTKLNLTHVPAPFDGKVTAAHKLTLRFMDYMVFDAFCGDECGRNAMAGDLKDWMAYTVRNPYMDSARSANWIPVLYSPAQGSGKSTFANTMGNIIGMPNMSKWTTSTVSDSFDRDIEGKMLINGDDWREGAIESPDFFSRFAGDPDSTISIRQFHKAARDIQWTGSMIISTNSLKFTPKALEERRLYLFTSDKVRNFNAGDALANSEDAKKLVAAAQMLGAPEGDMWTAFNWLIDDKANPTTAPFLRYYYTYIYRANNGTGINTPEDVANKMGAPDSVVLSAHNRDTAIKRRLLNELGDGTPVGELIQLISDVRANFNDPDYRHEYTKAGFFLTRDTVKQCIEDNTNYHSSKISQWVDAAFAKLNVSGATMCYRGGDKVAGVLPHRLHTLGMRTRGPVWYACADLDPDLVGKTGQDRIDVLEAKLAAAQTLYEAGLVGGL